MYTIKQDGSYFDDLSCLVDAIGLAEEMLADVWSDCSTIFSIEDFAGRVIASVSNRRVIGRFTKGLSSDQLGDQVIHIHGEVFEATDQVLSLPFGNVRELEDFDTTTDQLGRMMGLEGSPCEVEIVDSICDFFGVECLRDLTEENFDFAKNRRSQRLQSELAVLLATRAPFFILPGNGLLERSAYMNNDVPKKMSVD